MSDIRLHCFCQSGNAYKVALFLQCAGISWEPVFVDFMSAGVTRDPDWRSANNELGEVPVLEIDGKSLSQSGAILMYLSEKTGKFATDGLDQRTEALRWILFDNHKFTSYFATHRFMRSFSPKPQSADVLAFLKGRAESALSIVDGHLQSRRFMLGDMPTIADFSLVGYMFYPTEETGIDLAASYPNIHAWTDRVKGLPGWVGPYDLMPGDRIAPRQ
ncbi:MAG: glutathione S-transferase [Pseudomonadota bacterium]